MLNPLYAHGEMSKNDCLLEETQVQTLLIIIRLMLSD